MTKQSIGTSSLPVTVITGFLGSGKTTLLNALLRRPELAETAVLVNEFGEIGIDNLLIESLDEDVVLLNAGCLCCTIRNDLVSALTDLARKRARAEIPTFKRVVIETTGLADPAPIMHTLISHEDITPAYHVDAVVTAVDAVNGGGQLDGYEEALKQVAIADCLVVTKSDLSDRDELDNLKRRLQTINPTARLLEVLNGDIEPCALLSSGLASLENANREIDDWLACHALAHDQGAESLSSRHDDGISTFTLEAEQPVQIHRFVAWVERLLEREGEKLLRLKGLLDVCGSETPIVVHGVQHIFHPLMALSRWPHAERRSRLVLIGKQLDRDSVESTFISEVLSTKNSSLI